MFWIVFNENIFGKYFSKYLLGKRFGNMFGFLKIFWIFSWQKVLEPFLFFKFAEIFFWIVLENILEECFGKRLHKFSGFIFQFLQNILENIFGIVWRTFLKIFWKMLWKMIYFLKNVLENILENTF